MLWGNDFKLEASPWNTAESRYVEPLIDRLWEEVLKNATRLRKRISEDYYTHTLMRGYAGCQFSDKITDRTHCGYLWAYKKGIRLSQSGILVRRS